MYNIEVPLILEVIVHLSECLGDVVITCPIFNGNEIGAILAWWGLENYRLNNPQFDGMLDG